MQAAALHVAMEGLANHQLRVQNHPLIAIHQDRFEEDPWMIAYIWSETDKGSTMSTVEWYEQT